MPATPPDPKRFKPLMPKIPGVPDALAQPGEASPASAVPDEPPAPSFLASPAGRLAALAAAALVVGVLVAWWLMRVPRPATGTSQTQEEPQLVILTAPATLQPVVVAPSAGAAEIATLQELAKPWAAKKFFYRRRFTNESVPAMVVRQPGAATRGAAFWAFSLQAPFGRCELEFVTDLHTLANQYGYRANHPMVVDPCNATVYDPLRMGTLPSGAWARGEVVQGAGVRPPIGIDVHVKGDRLLASKME